MNKLNILALGVGALGFYFGYKALEEVDKLKSTVDDMQSSNEDEFEDDFEDEAFDNLVEPDKTSSVNAEAKDVGRIYPEDCV